MKAGRQTHFVRRVGVLVVLTAVFVLAPLAGQVNSPLFLYETSELVIETQDGATATFKVVAVTKSEDLAQGLMNVQFMPLDQGMLFLHRTKRNVSMWMKDTRIALDMWFVSNEGVITKVVTETTPESTDLIRSDGPVTAVVEVNAGLSSLIGVAPGARIRHSAFADSDEK